MSLELNEVFRFFCYVVEVLAKHIFQFFALGFIDAAVLSMQHILNHHTLIRQSKEQQTRFTVWVPLRSCLLTNTTHQAGPRNQLHVV